MRISFRNSLLVLLVLLGLTLLAASCQGYNNDTASRSASEAQYLSIVDTLGYQRVDVYSPWQPGQLLSRLYLVREDSVCTPSDAPRVRVPIECLAATSATQVGFLHAIQADSCICALATPHLIYNAPAREVVDLGEDFNLNVEKLLLSSPQLVLMTSYGEPLTNVDRIRQAGVPVLEIVEWMEQAPLSRAAWIRLYGALTGKLPLADSILTQVTDDYLYTQQSCSMTTVSVAMGESYRGTWYVPSGATYMGHFLSDAGAQYAFADRQTVGSIPLTLEQAITTFSEADVWLGVNEKSLDELARLDEKHTWMKAYQEGRVYNFARRVTPTGGNDFWETGIVHPEYILQDIRWAMDSAACPGYEPYFIMRLQ